MSLMSMFTRPKISLDANLPRPDTAHTVPTRRSYKDYSNCLVSVSWHQLTDEEAAARIASDFNNDFLWIRGPGGFQDYYHKPDVVPLRELANPNYADTRWFHVFQIDLLRPAHDYIDLRSGGRDYAILVAEQHFEEAMRSLGIMPNWWTICCSTMNDHPMSAYRRSIMVLGRDVHGNDAPYEDIVVALANPATLERIEDALEHSLRAEIEFQTFE